jgi:hypothetical protein
LLMLEALPIFSWAAAGQTRTGMDVIAANAQRRAVLPARMPAPKNGRRADDRNRCERDRKVVTK